MKQRIGIFVDVQNMFYSAKNIYKTKLDYKALLENLTAERELVRAVAYIIQRNNQQDNFYDALERIGYELRIKEIRSNKPDDKGGSYETLLTIDVISVAPKLDTIILVTGDSSYIPLITYLQAHGCKVEVASFDGSTSHELMESADKFIKIPKEWTFSVTNSITQECEEDEPQPIVDNQPTVLGMFSQ